MWWQKLNEKLRLKFKWYYNARIDPLYAYDNIDDQMMAIQRSTKTLFKFAQPTHEKLRLKYSWYYKWHVRPQTHKIHWALLGFYTTTLIFFFVLTLSSHPQIVKAATTSCTWTNGGANNIWNNAANWSCGEVPDSTKDVIFNGAVSNADITIDVAATAGSFTVNGGGGGGGGVAGQATAGNTGNHLNFSTNGANVAVSGAGVFSGYGWSEDLGWIAFGTADNAADGPVSENTSTGAVTGKAKILNDGSLIDFNASPYNSNVVVNTGTGAFSGYAWSTSLGWINFTGVSLSSPAYTGTITVNSPNSLSTTIAGTGTGDFTMNDGSITGTGNVTIVGNVAGSAGVINMTGGTFTQNVAANKAFGTSVAGTTAWTFNNLTFASSSGTPTITTSTTGTGDITVNNVLTINTGTVFDAGNRTYHLMGSGVPFVKNGVTAPIFIANTSTFSFENTTSATISGCFSTSAYYDYNAYYNLQTNPASGTPTYILKGTGTGASFLAGTKVKTDQGNKNIEDFKIGDKVLSYDINTNQPVLSEVTDTIQSTKDGYYIINSKVKATGNHVFILSDNSQKKAEDLKTGDILKTYSGTETIQTIEKINQTVSVYDLEVKDYHLFYAENFLVHNRGEIDYITVKNNFNITTGGSGAAIIDAETNDPYVLVEGNFTIGASQTYQASSTAYFTIKGNYSNTGTFTSGIGTVTFNGTSTGHTINPGVSNGNFYNLTIYGSGGAWSPLNNTINVTNDLTMADGTFDTSSGTANVMVSGNTSCGATTCGTINMTAGTFTQNVAANKNFGTNVAGTTAWTFNNLTFASSTGTPTITTSTTGTGDITVNNVLNIAASTTFDAGNRTYHLLGTGTPVTLNGFFNYNTSTMSYENTTSATISNITFNNLQTNPASGTPTYTLETGKTSFLAGTKVKTSNGTKNIEDFKVGDKVLSYDINTNQPVMSEVTNTIQSTKDAYYIINGKVKATGNHVFILPDNSQKKVEYMKVGDILKTYSGTETIQTLEKIDKTVPVYDIEVKDTHLFYAENYLVHNFGATGFSVNSINMTGAGSATLNANVTNVLLSIHGNVTIGANQTFQASGSQTTTIEGSFTNSGTFTHNNGTVKIFSNTTTINDGASSFYNLQLISGGAHTSPLTNTLRVANDLTMGLNGILDNTGGSADVTVNGNVLCDSLCGTINLTSGTFTQNVAANKNFGTSVAGTTAWTFNNLTFSSSTGTPTITTSTTGTGDITVNAVLNIAASTTFAAGNRTYHLMGTGTPFTKSGTLSSNTSTMSFENTTSASIAAVSYYNLQTNPASGTPTYTLKTTSTSFLAGTKVRTQLGTKNIEDLRIGDMVESYDTVNNRKVISAVTGTVQGDKPAYYLINGRVKASGNHVFILADNTPKTVDDLSVGDVLATYSGQEKIETITKYIEPVKVYDIEVENYHLFYAENYLVHNGPGSISLDISNNFLATGGGSATVDFSGNTNANSIHGNLTINTNQTFKAQATGNFNIAGNFANSGTFNANSGTVTFDATASGHTINPGTSHFYNLTFSNFGGAWSPLTNKVYVDNDLWMAAGTFDTSSGTADVEVRGNVFGSDGVINMTSTNTFTQNVAANKNFGTSMAGTTAWTFNDLTFSVSDAIAHTITTSTTGTGDITVNNVLNIAASTTFDAGNRTYHLMGTGTPFTNSGTFTANISTFSFEGASGNIIISSVTYYNLQTSPASGTVTYILGNGGFAAPCFLAGTKILVKNGETKNIEDLIQGDKILSYDVSSSQSVESTVEQTFKSSVDRYYIINDKVRPTGNHVFFLADKSMKQAKDLKVGDVLATSSGTETVNKIEIVNQHVEVYDIEVQTYHTFYAENYLVHNTNPVTVNNNFTLTGAGAGTVDIGYANPSVTINGNVSIGSGQTLIASNSSPSNVKGNWTNAGTFTPGIGTVIFNGTGAQTLNSGGTGAGKMFNNLTHSGAGTLQLLNTALNIDSNFTNSAGTFDTNSLDMTVGGNVNLTGGSFTQGTRTITLDGSATQLFTAGGVGAGHTPYNLTLANTSGVSAGVTFTDSLTLATGGRLTNTTQDSRVIFADGGTYTIPNITITSAAAHNILLQKGTGSHGQWHFVVVGTPTVSYATPSNSDATGSGAAITGGTDGGNNTNWDFGAAMPNAPTIGTPTVQSATSIRWVFADNSSNETGFKVYDGANNLKATCVGVNFTYCDETGLSVNTLYNDRHVVAYNANGNSTNSATASAIYTLADTPVAPTVNQIYGQPTQLQLIVGTNTNPAATQFAIRETQQSEPDKYVQADGSLNTSAVWQTFAQWGSGIGTTITGLTAGTQYTFDVKARNGDNTETAFGTPGAQQTTPGAGNTVSGSLYDGIGGAKISVAKTIHVSVNGNAAATTETSSGDYTVTANEPLDANDIITIFVSGETEKASTVTKVSATGNLTTIDLYQNYTTIRHEGTITNIANSDLATADNLADPDQLFSVDGSSKATYTAGLYVLAAKTYTPTGDTAATNVNIAGTLNGGTYTHTASGNWTRTGTFNYDTSTVDLTGTGSVSGGTFYSLNAAANTKTTTVLSNGTITIQNVLTLGTGTYHTGGTANTNFNLNNGTPLVTGGAAINSNLFFNGTGTVNIPGTTYNKTILFKGAGGTYNLNGDVTMNSDGIIIFAVAGLATVQTNDHAINGATSIQVGDGGNDPQSFNRGKIICGNSTINVGDLNIYTGQNGGSILQADSSTINIGGNYSNSNNFTAGTSTVNFTKSSGTQTLNSGGTGTGKAFYDITHSGAGTLQLLTNDVKATHDFLNYGGTFTTLDGATSRNVTVDNNFTINNSSTVTANASTFIVGGSWDHSAGNFTFGTSAINLTGTGSINFSNTKPVYNLTAAATGKATTFTGSWSTINGVLTLGTGTISGSQVIFGGSSVNPLVTSGATLANIDVYWCPSSNSNIPATIYKSLNIQTGWNTHTLAGDITITNILSLVGNYSSVILNTADHNISAGSLSIGTASPPSSSTFNLGSSTVTSGSVTIYAPAATYANTINLNSGTLKIGGNYANDGTLTSNSGTVEFTKASGTQTLNSGGTGAGKSFNNLTHSGAGTLQLITNDLDINGNFLNSGGTFDSNTKNVNIAGNFTLNNTTTFTKGGTLTFDGTTAATYTDSNTTTQNIGTVVQNKTDIVDPANNNKLTLASSMTVDSINIDGTLATADTLYTGLIGGNILTVNGGATTIGINAALAGAGQLTLVDAAGAALSTTGTLSAKTRFTTATTDVTIPARTYGGTVDIYNGTSSSRVATLGTATSQTINLTALTLATNSTGELWTKGQTYNPIINISADFTTSHASSGAVKTGMGTSTWTISGNINLSRDPDKVSTDGVNTPTAGKLIMNGSNKTINNVALWPQLWIYDMQFSSNVTINNYAQLAVYHSLLIDNGVTVTLNDSSGYHEGIAMQDGATTTINGTVTGSSNAGQITFVNAASGLISATGTISSLVNFYINSSTAKLSARTYSGPVIFNGVWTDTIQLGTGADQTINFGSNVTIQRGTDQVGVNTIDASVYNPNINIAGNLSITSGGNGSHSLKSGSGTWSVSGNVDFTNATVTPGDSTLDLAKSSDTQTLTTASQSLNNLTHSGAGTAQLVDPLTLNGNFTNSDGIFSTSSNNITIGGNYSNAGTFTAGTSEIIFDAGEAGHTLAGAMTGTSAFDNLTFNNAPGGWTLNNDIKVASVLNINAGTLNATSSTIELAGAGTPFVKTGTFNADTSTVKYTAPADTTITAADYYHLDLIDPPTGTVETLVVAGGGGGAAMTGGGGGAGGLLYDAAHVVSDQAYSITVGDGGPGQVGSANPGYGSYGEDSIFGDLTAVGGGRGGTNAAPNGGNGGSGGGCGHVSCTGGIRTINQGNNGGSQATTAPYYGASGGGGAGGVGMSGTSNVGGGDGGDGLNYSISGSNVYYAGGGGGGSYPTTGALGAGGLGGGGSAPAGNATANTGGGGGGQYNNLANGGSGGSGVVIISYATDGSDGISTDSTGGLVTTSGGKTIHTFTTDGTFTAVLVSGPVYTLSSGTFNIDGNLVIGNSTDTMSVTADTNDPIIDVEGNVSITANSTLVASNSAAFTVGSNWTNAGIFTHSSGTVTFDTTNTTAFTGSTTFNNLVMNTTTDGAKTITFPTGTGNKQVVAGTWTLDGAVGKVLTLVSASPTTAWYFDIAAPFTSGDYIDVTDSWADPDTNKITAGTNVTNGGNNDGWIFNQAPTNDSLTFTNPYSSNIAVSNDTTEWQFQAKVTDADGPTNINYVEIHFANAADSTTPYDSLKYRYTRGTNTFSEVADTQGAGTITSTTGDATSSGNQWTVNFKIKLNNNFLDKDTNYAAELYTVDNAAASDLDNYANIYKVAALIISLDVDSATIAFGGLLPGSILTATTISTVTTNYPNGYNLAISDAIAGTGSALLHTDTATHIVDYTAPISLPTLWSGTGLGICVYSATGKNAKWGTGTTETDTQDKYAGVPETTTTIHSKTSSPTSSDVTKTGYKVVVPNNQKTGDYSGNVTYTATGVLL